MMQSGISDKHLGCFGKLIMVHMITLLLGIYQLKLLIILRLLRLLFNKRTVCVCVCVSDKMKLKRHRMIW